MPRIKTPENLEKHRKALLSKRDPKQPVITVCAGTGCGAYGCHEVVDAFRTTLKEKNLEPKVHIRTTGCHGFCERGPLVVVYPQEFFYQRVKPDDAEEIVEKTVLKGETIERLQFKDPVTGERVVKESDVPFYKYQTRIIFGDNGHIDPRNIEDYIALGGYSALVKALTSMKPDEVVETVTKSGLFPHASSISQIVPSPSRSVPATIWYLPGASGGTVKA